MNPIANIKFPENDFKIDDEFIIPLEIEVVDDYGLNKVKLNYKIILILMGVVDTLALLIMVYSGNFNHPEFSSVSASTFGLITILLVCFFYKEKLNFIQMLGISLVFSSIAILTLS